MEEEITDLTRKQGVHAYLMARPDSAYCLRCELQAVIDAEMEMRKAA